MKGSIVNDRFWSLVDQRGPEECWKWVGPLNNQGYGRFRISAGDNGSRHHRALAHRYAYEITTGENIDGKVLMHSCDNPRCVNPSHLTPGTQSENVLDSVAKGRANRSHGEAHRDARLTADQVKAIREADVSRYGALEEMGREYGVSSNSIRKILSRKTWRHVA